MEDKFSKSLTGFRKNLSIQRYLINFFFNYYLAAPRPTSGHYRGDSLTHPMLITAFYIFDPKVTGSLVAKNMLEKWKNTLGKGGFVCAMFMDLSSGFDTMNHDLLIAKLGAYGFQKDAISWKAN